MKIHDLKTIFCIAIFMNCFYLNTASAENRILITTDQLYKSCKVSLQSSDFGNSSCGFYLNGFFQGFLISLTHLQSFISDKNAAEKYLTEKFCMQMFNDMNRRKVASIYVSAIEAQQDKESIKNKKAYETLADVIVDYPCKR